MKARNPSLRDPTPRALRGERSARLVNEVSTSLGIPHGVVHSVHHNAALLQAGIMHNQQAYHLLLQARQHFNAERANCEVSFLKGALVVNNLQGASGRHPPDGSWGMLLAAAEMVAAELGFARVRVRPAGRNPHLQEAAESGVDLRKRLNATARGEGYSYRGKWFEKKL